MIDLWDFSGVGLDAPLPDTKAGCMRETLARFVDPLTSHDLLLIPVPYGRSGRGIRKQYEIGYITEAERHNAVARDRKLDALRGEYGKRAVERAVPHYWTLVHQEHCERAYPVPDADVERSIRLRHPLLAPARMEILPLDFDATPREAIFAFTDWLEIEGYEWLRFPSGSVPGMRGRTHTGYRVLVITRDATDWEFLATRAKKIGADVLTVNDRVPGFPYKAIAMEAPDWMKEKYGRRWVPDPSRKRELEERLWTLPNLQAVVRFLRLVPVRAEGWFGPGCWYETWRPAELNPRDRLDPISSSVLVPECPRIVRMSENRVSPQGGALPEDLASRLDRLPLKWRILLDEGDVGERYKHKNGRPDRSAMAFALLFVLRARGWTREGVWKLVESKKPGLISYRDRRTFFEHDWKRNEAKGDITTEQIPRGRKRRVAAAAVAQMPESIDLLVLLVLCSFNGVPAPGYRRLSEITGYSLRTIFLSIGRLVASGWLRRFDPIRGPGDILAQEFELLIPEEVTAARKSRDSTVNSLVFSRRGRRRLLQQLRVLRDSGVPLRFVFGGTDPPGRDVRDLVTVGAIPLLGRMGQARRFAAKRWSQDQRAFHAIEREVYRDAVRQAEARNAA